MWLRHLPSDAALTRRRLGGDPLPSDTDRLAAITINELRTANYFTLAQHSEDVEPPTFIDLDEKED